MRVVRLSDVLDEIIPCTELPIIIVNDLRCWRSYLNNNIKQVREQERNYWIRLSDGKRGTVFSFDPVFVFNPLCFDGIYGYCLKKDHGNFLRYIPHYSP